MFASTICFEYVYYSILTNILCIFYVTLEPFCVVLIPGFARFDGSLTKHGKVQELDRSWECSSASGQLMA